MRNYEQDYEYGGMLAKTGTCCAEIHRSGKIDFFTGNSSTSKEDAY